MQVTAFSGKTTAALNVDKRKAIVDEITLRIFKETSIYCPVSAPDCAGYPNQTYVTIYNDTSLEYQAYMDATVPGGQNV